jgi:hypothetical protein
MKLFISLSLSVFCLQISAQAREVSSVHGNIIDYVAGEIDPYLVGDACIVRMVLKNGTPVAFVTDYESCEENSEELQNGRGLTVAIETHNRITDAKTLELLRRSLAARVYYYVDFGAIENGLADELDYRVEPRLTVGN